MPPAPVTIGFPPPLLGPSPLRLAVLHAGDDVVALEKPAGVTWERDKFSDGDGVCEAFRAQLATGKPELASLGLTAPASVWPVEKELAGIGLLAERGTAHQHLRNAFGSAGMTFTYEFLAADFGDEDAFESTLPVAEHFSEPRALISHTTGKKSTTTFYRRARVGHWSWWRAVTDYPRRHQVRLHAAEAGLRIVGETLYAQGDVIFLSQVMPSKRLNKGDDRPLHDGICLRMVTVDCTRVGLGNLGLITAPEPAKWAVLRKRLAGGGKN